MKSSRGEKAHVIVQRAAAHVVVQPCCNGRRSTRSVFGGYGQEERRPAGQLHHFGYQPLKLAAGSESAQARVPRQLVERAYELAVRLALLEEPGEASTRRSCLGHARAGFCAHNIFSNTTSKRYI